MGYKSNKSKVFNKLRDKNIRTSRRRPLDFIEAPPLTDSRSKVKEEETEPPCFDPELLYIECGRCGAPVMWEAGRAARMLENAGINPFELDEACLIVTDGCPACGEDKEYEVRIFRFGASSEKGFPPVPGHD